MFQSDLKVSAGNSETLVSLVASPSGSFLPKGESRPITWDDSYKLGILRIGKNPINVRLTVEDVDLLIQLFEEVKEVLN